MDKMAYDKATDLEQIQADVLGSSLASNSKITGLNKLKTSAQVVLRAINEINNKLASALTKTDQATAAATEAKQDVENVKEEAKTLVQETITQKMTEIVSGNIQNDEFCCEDGQTVFALSKTPADKDNILFYVNGVKYLRSDWSYDEANNEATWLNTNQATKGFVISKADAVSIVYISK
jgi:hypothetical protein